MSFADRFGALQERQFRLFFVGQTTSLLGDEDGEGQGDGDHPVAIATAINLAALSTPSIRGVRARASPAAAAAD